jgi:hypothetical protein
MRLLWCVSSRRRVRVLRRVSRDANGLACLLSHSGTVIGGRNNTVSRHVSVAGIGVVVVVIVGGGGGGSVVVVLIIVVGCRRTLRRLRLTHTLDILKSNLPAPTSTSCDPRGSP